MKTREEILGISSYPHECGSMIEMNTRQDSLKAMQEYSDAVLAEYKAKVKDEVKKRYSIPGTKFWYPTCAEIENLIDTTEI